MPQYLWEDDPRSKCHSSNHNGCKAPPSDVPLTITEQFRRHSTMSHKIVIFPFYQKRSIEPKLIQFLCLTVLCSPHFHHFSLWFFSYHPHSVSSRVPSGTFLFCEIIVCRWFFIFRCVSVRTFEHSSIAWVLSTVERLFPFGLFDVSFYSFILLFVAS